MNLKKSIKRLFFQLGLAVALDRVVYWRRMALWWRANNAFKKQHPWQHFPPAKYRFEVFGPSLQSWHEGGRETAQWIYDIARRHLSVSKGIKVLEWGCGPGRIISHLPELFQGGGSHRR